MKRRTFTSSLLTGVTLCATPGLSLGANERFSLVADLAECCSCEIPCPCNFGLPTELRCDGNRLIEIRSGHFEGADLTGIRFLVTFLMGNWTRIHIDESMTPEQQEIFDRMFPVIFAGFDRLARTKQRVAMTVERGEEVLRFSVPESSVEMKLMAGLDGEKIVVTGLPNPAYHEYTQYMSVEHRHASADATWTYAGTNGFTSVMRVSG